MLRNFSFVAVVAFLSGLCGQAKGDGPYVLTPTTTDLWDISQGATITNSSPCLDYINCGIQNMFSSNYSATTLFYGGIGVDSVEWQTPQPITLQSFALFAGHDSTLDNRDASYRGFSRFSLYCYNDSTSQWMDVYNIFPSNPYGSTPTPANTFIDYSYDTIDHSRLSLTANITPTTAQRFRAEFQEWTVWPYMGPRVIKLEGFNTLSTIFWKGGNDDTSTAWGVANNWWNPSSNVPDGPGVKVSFGSQSQTSPIVDMVSVGRTVGSIAFTDTTSTTVRSTYGFALTLDNNGSVSTIDVEGNHTVSAPVILNNDAIISGTGTLDLSGGITGSHDLEVDINLTVKSIYVDNFTIGNGAKLTIQAISGGYHGNTIVPIPEPSTFVLLGIGAISLLTFAWRRRKRIVLRQSEKGGTLYV